MFRLIAIAVLACAPLLARADSPIVGAAYVADALSRGAVVWDVRDAAQFRKGHIPGAVNIGDAGAVLRNPNTEDFIPTPTIERILGAAGIDPAREVVVYGARGNAYAYFGQFAIQHFGGRNVRVFHDGIDGWIADGRPLSTTPAEPRPVVLKLEPRPEISASTAQMVAALQRRDVQLLDARTPAEFRGDDVRAIRGGHVPGATNIPYEQNWVDPDAATKLARRQVANNAGMSLKADDELRRLYAGLDPAKETIVYCQSGVRAAETAAVLRHLGFRDVKVYDASWLGYASTLSAPVQGEVFFNVGALNGRLAGLQARIEQLERELAAAKGAR